MARLDLDGFKNFFKYYSEESHQVEGVEELYRSLPESLLAEDSKWVELYRNISAPVVVDEKVLDVQYFSQLDNYRDASRTCYSSSCAMLLDYVNPGAISGDDE